MRCQGPAWSRLLEEMGNYMVNHNLLTNSLGLANRRKAFSTLCYEVFSEESLGCDSRGSDISKSFGKEAARSDQDEGKENGKGFSNKAVVRHHFVRAEEQYKSTVLQGIIKRLRMGGAKEHISWSLESLESLSAEYLKDLPHSLACDALNSWVVYFCTVFLKEWSYTWSISHRVLLLFGRIS